MSVTDAPYPPRDGEGDRAKRGGGGSSSLRHTAVYTAPSIRRPLSPPEALLWQHLRLRPAGLKFCPQHPVDPYIVDFFCREASLVIEVDGEVHGTNEAQERDVAREEHLMGKGLKVLRIPAGEVMRDCSGTVAAILARAGSPLHQPSAGPPPRPGEDI